MKQTFITSRNIYSPTIKSQGRGETKRKNFFLLSINLTTNWISLINPNGYLYRGKQAVGSKGGWSHPSSCESVLNRRLESDRLLLEVKWDAEWLEWLGSVGFWPDMPMTNTCWTRQQNTQTDLWPTIGSDEDGETPRFKAFISCKHTVYAMTFTNIFTLI